MATPFSLQNLQATVVEAVKAAQRMAGNPMSGLLLVVQPRYAEDNWLAEAMHTDPAVLVVSQPQGQRFDRARSAKVNRISVGLVVNPRANAQQFDLDPWVVVGAIQDALHRKPERDDWLEFVMAQDSVPAPEDIDGLIHYVCNFEADTFLEDI